MSKRPSNTEHSHDEHPELIARTARGEVRRCPDCGALHLRFGNAVLALHADDLATLRAAVESSPRRRKANGDPASGRCVELFLGESGVGFAFDTIELMELDTLLETTASRVARDSAPASDAISDLLNAFESELPPVIARRMGGSRYGRP